MSRDTKKENMIQNYYYMMGFFTILFVPIILTLVFNNMYDIAFLILGLFTLIGVPGAIRGHPIVRARRHQINKN